MKKKVANWVNSANNIGTINVHIITTCGVSDYLIDCGSFSWCRMNAEEYKQLTSALNNNVKINII